LVLSDQAHVSGSTPAERTQHDAPLTPREIEVVDLIDQGLFTDIVGSTESAAALGDVRWRELLAAHNAAVRDQLNRWHGREIDNTGDGFLASFDGPARAIRCACAIRDQVQALGLEIRAGLHTGECERVGDKLVGLAVQPAHESQR
jgi:class 3 adenylate cyclase